MTTLIRTDRDAASGRARVDTRSDLLRPMLLYSGATHARVALVAQGALLLAGDHVTIEVEVGAGTTLDIVEPSGTVAYDMRGASARWDVRITLQDRAELRWHGEPFVISEGADVARSVTVRLAEDSTCLLRETLVLGRSGEPPGLLRSRSRIVDPQGAVLAEDLELSPESQVGGILGMNRVIDSVIAIGRDFGRHDIHPYDRMRLERNGSVWRRLGTDAHAASLAELWRNLVSDSGGGAAFCERG